MTDTEKATLCTRIDELCAENERMRQENQSVGMAAYELGRKSMADENAELREDLEFERSENGWAREFLNRMGQKCGTKDCPSLVAYVTKLEDENAKLREQVDYMTPLALYVASERERDRMRELGVGE